MLTTKTYDFAVIGAGVFGAWTAHYLRRGGASVVLIDAYGPANSRASSGGETRVIRMGYGPDELYTRWAARSLPEWKNLAERTGKKIFQRTGMLWLSDESDPYTKDLLQVLRKCGVAHERLSAEEIHRRYPQLSFSDVTCGVAEPESGALLARQGVQALVEEERENGMDFIQAAVLAPEPLQTRMQEVKIGAGDSVAAGVFIFACGPWLPKLFPQAVGGRIHPTRQEVFFFGPPAGSDDFRAPKMPIWIHHSHPIRPYALPDVEGRGFKIGLDRHGPQFDPDTGNRVVDQASIAELRAYLKDHVPGLSGAPIVETRVCQYENTSNGDFLIDHHPECENVWLVGGGSGHGFKHGPAVGEHVSKRIQSGAPGEPRFSLAGKATVRARSVF